MTHTNANTGSQPRQRKWLLPIGVAAIAVSSAIVVSCFHDDDSPTLVSSTDTFLPTEPDPLNVIGSSLFCDSATVTPPSTVAATLKVEAPDSIAAMNISFDEPNESFNNHNAANNLKRLSAVVIAETPNGTEATEDDGTGNLVPIGDVHPLIVSYGEQVIGGYEGGDGSADIGDPDNIDDIFVSLSLDNGKSWQKMHVGDTAKDSGGNVRASSIVTWDGVRTPYPGHSHKPTMHIQGNNILVAWNDKYCPSGNPFDLEDPATEDYYKVNGAQGTVDYGGVIAPNGKELFEVPYSCVWTARGVFDPDDLDGENGMDIEWRQAKQLTSGTRDSNKIWIAPAEVGFAITWQEDPDGLRPGKGEGPGAGYSGATTNHGADIWYTYITMDDFDDVCTEFDADGVCTASTDDPMTIANLAEKPKPAVNFTYPVRISNNDTCTPDDTKLYCADNCVAQVSVTSNNQSGTSITRCVQNDLDYMTADETIAPQAAVLDGDTGASRPALKILKTNAPEPEFVAILAYEETKGLSEATTQDQGDTITDIALEGKAVYLETFFWDQPVEVSASRPVNLRVPKATVEDDVVTLTGEIIYENARRVVILPQVDACEMQDGDPTFALMYKQGYETQGGPSDMFIRLNTGFIYDDFATLAGLEATNISSHANTNDPYDAAAGEGSVVWTTTNLEDMSYTYPADNTFSPRGWLRGGEVYTGFEFSPLWRATSVGTVPNNFWIHRYVDSAWQGPMQLSITTGAKISTLDPRFIPTPKGSNTTLDSDDSNPDVIFLGYGTFDMDSGDELDLYYSRSTDKGATWEYLDAGGVEVITNAGADGIPGTDDDDAARLAKLAARDVPVHEMELQGLASPDGTMFFGAWLRETPTVVNNHQDGLESEFGRVDYDMAK